MHAKADRGIYENRLIAGKYTKAGSRVQSIRNSIWNLIEKTAVFFLKLLLGIIGKKPSDHMIDAFIQFVKFGIVGVSNTVLSYLIYVVSLIQFRNLNIFTNTDYFAANTLAFVLSVLWSFYWNNRMVFTLEDGEERSILKALLKTYVSYSFTGLFLNSILLVLWVKVLHISEFAAPVINLIVSVPLNFIINKFWAFRKE